MTLGSFVDWFFQWGCAVASMIAAICWMKSAIVELPNMTENTTWEGKGAFPDALKLQSFWNARAAKFAAVAAFFQGLQFIKTVPPFWPN